ncbi:MAG: glycosyltransferase family 4 protein [Candidatus Limnocylindrales bacterium]
MIRVGLVLGGQWLGGINYHRNLLRAILAVPDRRIEPVLLAGADVDAATLAGFPPVEVVRSPWLDRGTPRWLGRRLWQQAFASDPFLQRVLEAHRIDVLSHSGVLGRGSSIPTICWLVDFQHRQLPQSFTALERFYRDRNFRLQADRATRILLSSFDAQRDLAAFRPSSVSRSRVLQFVAQPDIAAAASLKELDERYGVNGPYVHLPNQFWSHKNHRLVIEALGRLRLDGRSVTVIATGATTDYRRPQFFQDLMRQVADTGVEESFRVLGIVPQRDLAGLMINAVALINPSRAEGWSTTVEEAKSIGKRIIVSDIRVHREQAPPDGLYVDPDDAAGLAESMWTMVTTYDATAEHARMARAQQALPGRVLAFGRAYEAIVRDAAGESPSSTQADGA